MSYIVAPGSLAVGANPVFIGYLRQWIKTENPVDFVEVSFEASDVDEIRLSMFRKNANIIGLNAMNLASTPVEDWQDVFIDKSTITAPTTYDTEFFETLQIQPFESNFLYMPENVPLLFSTAGVYIARFTFTMNDGSVHPVSVEFLIR